MEAASKEDLFIQTVDESIYLNSNSRWLVKQRYFDI